MGTSGGDLLMVGVGECTVALYAKFIKGSQNNTAAAFFNAAHFPILMESVLLTLFKQNVPPVCQAHMAHSNTNRHKHKH